MKQPIFVFGSNQAGRHGKGAALRAKEHHGAIYGQPEGRQGNSYAIPTKDEYLDVLPLPAIQDNVKTFIQYAVSHPDLEFNITPIGCGLAGYKETMIAPFFLQAPANCTLPDGWRDIESISTPERITKDIHLILQGRYGKMAEKTMMETKINNMMGAVVENCLTWPADKTGRIVGYVQCLLIEVCRKTTINAEREFTRPLFNILYKKTGVSIPGE